MEPNLTTKQPTHRRGRRLVRLSAAGALAVSFSGALANRHVSQAHAIALPAPTVSGELALFCPEGPGQSSAYVHYQAINDTASPVSVAFGMPDGTESDIQIAANDHVYLDMPVAEGQHVTAFLHHGQQSFGDIDTTVDCQEDPPTTTEAPTTTESPTTTAAPPTTGEIPPPPPEGGLPETGDDGSGQMALVAGLFGLAGLAIMAVTRRRTSKV